MIYRNVKTGAIIHVKSAVSGGDWVKVEQKAPATPKPKKKSKKAVEK